PPRWLAFHRAPLQGVLSQHSHAPGRTPCRGSRGIVSWKLVANAPKAEVQTALAAHEAIDDWDPEIVLTGSEVSEDRPDDWVLEAYLTRRPSDADREAVAALFADAAPPLAAEELPAAD